MSVENRPRRRPSAVRALATVNTAGSEMTQGQLAEDYLEVAAFLSDIQRKFDLDMLWIKNKDIKEARYNASAYLRIFEECLVIEAHHLNKQPDDTFED